MLCSHCVPWIRLAQPSWKVGINYIFYYSCHWLVSVNQKSSRCVILSTTILEPIEDWSSCNIHVCHWIHFRIKYSLQSKQLSMGCHLCQNNKKPSIYKWSAPYTGVLHIQECYKWHPIGSSQNIQAMLSALAIAIAQHVGPPNSQPPSATSQPSASQSSPALSASAKGTAYMEYSIWIWSTPFVYGTLHLYMKHSIYICSTPFIYGTPHLYMEHPIYIWSSHYIFPLKIV